MSTPQLNEKWSRLFGAARPATKPDALPPVPHALFGLNAPAGNVEVKRAVREKRLNGVVEYLRENGPMKTAQLSTVFGVTDETMTKDVRELMEMGRIRKVDERRPALWEAI